MHGMLRCGTLHPEVAAAWRRLPEESASSRRKGQARSVAGGRCGIPAAAQDQASSCTRGSSRQRWGDESDDHLSRIVALPPHRTPGRVDGVSRGRTALLQRSVLPAMAGTAGSVPREYAGERAVALIGNRRRLSESDHPEKGGISRDNKPVVWEPRLLGTGGEIGSIGEEESPT